MKKIAYFIFIISFLVSCGKSYKLDDKPVILLVTNLGEIKIKLYKNSAPKASSLFIDFVKKGKYNNTQIDEVMFFEQFINIGFNSKTFDPAIKEDFNSEINPENKKLSYGELLFNPKNEGFGAFSIYTGKEDIKLEEPQVIFAKVVEGNDVITKIMEARVDNLNRPLEKIEIKEAKVIE
ncbi:MAG TPA: peptidylprolyl isomerase [Spirochaetota bacterium]|nr:peptidylprolyl isomerase [Spirochaetota bacterium]HOM38070.1 peptidylprolyl isomerase [Spirochaetota bacterium]HPQ48873.1 peptidylprolyl isomerase [Spirochaetota bacterium]